MKNLNSQDCSLHSQVETTSKNSTVRIIARDKYLGHGPSPSTVQREGLLVSKDCRCSPAEEAALGCGAPEAKPGPAGGS